LVAMVRLELTFPCVQSTWLDSLPSSLLVVSMENWLARRPGAAPGRTGFGIRSDRWNAAFLEKKILFFYRPRPYGVPGFSRFPWGWPPKGGTPYPPDRWSNEVDRNWKKGRGSTHAEAGTWNERLRGS